MNAPVDLAVLVLLDVLRHVAVECMVTSISVGTIPALTLLAIVLKVVSRKAAPRHPVRGIA